MAKIDYSGRKEAMERLEKEFRHLEICVIGIAVMLVSGIIAATFSKFYLAEAIMISTALFFFFYFKKKQKQYQNDCVTENLRAVVLPLLGAQEVHEKDGAGITVETVRAAELVPVNANGHSVSCFQGISGRYRKIDVKTCDIAIVESIMNGGRGTMINCGNWTHAHLPADTGLNLRISDRRVLPEGLVLQYLCGKLGLAQLDPASCGVDNAFVCCAEPEEDVSGAAGSDDRGRSSVIASGFLTEDRPLSSALSGKTRDKLPENFRQKLAELAAFTPGAIAISIRGQEVDVYIRNRFLAARFSATAKVREDMLNFNPLPELERVCELIHSLLPARTNF